jgi:hypothetical protein
MCLLGIPAVTRAIDHSTRHTGDGYRDKRHNERDQRDQGFDAIGAPQQRIVAKDAADPPAARV